MSFRGVNVKVDIQDAQLAGWTGGDIALVMICVMNNPVPYLDINININIGAEWRIYAAVDQAIFGSGDLSPAQR